MSAIELTDQQADDWLARLEDPDTKRFEGRLRDLADAEAMCCLGHLADIIDPEAWTENARWWSWGDGLVGLTHDLPSVTYRGMRLEQDDMTFINDGEHRFPVAEIREWIEEARVRP